ncbi:MAG: hypothetical protein HY809_02060 [Nitrospirae bacterium]|nr:hypothetical protein [Nitrospirota bacterium]
MKIKIIFALILLFIAMPPRFSAEEKEPAGGLFRLECHESPKYFIIVKEVKGSAGSDILIKYKGNPDEKYSCDYALSDGGFEIKNEWAEYYAGLKDNLLLLDSTTGPGPSGLIIWDLQKRKKAFEGSWSDAEESGSGSLVYWLETDEASEGNCPDMKEWETHGLGAAIETKVILNLSDFTITKTAETRCSARQ